VTPSASLVVGRALGTVVVTVDGALDGAGSRRLGQLLIDLIDGQGNTAVAVDLGKATVGPAAVAVFLDAGRRADRHGTTFVLQAPAPEAHRTLRSVGLDARIG
jgi:anti-anti-sigma regulatory factor